MKNIIQIIPCNVELYAKFTGYHDEVIKTRVIALALVDEEDREGRWRRIVGVDFTEDQFTIVDDAPNFIGYDQPTTDSPA